MNKNNVDYTLYFCTDRTLMSCYSVEKSVELAIDGGASVIQLREKNLSSRDFYETALSVLQITKPRGVPLIINDRLDICLAAGADGVHLGQSDIPCSVARKILGNEKIIGVSSHNPAEALRAQADGADYLGVGAAFSTHTKTDVDVLPEGELKKICDAVDVPVVAIGGIHKDNILQLKGSGADGVALVSAIFGAEDIEAECRELKALAEQII